MGVDYMIDLDCEPKQQLSIEGLVNLVKARNRAETILALERQQGNTGPASEMKFDVVINRQGNVETTEVSVQELLDDAAALDAHRATCARCPANRDAPHGFGCYRAIGYPIEADTERFLLSRLPDNLEGPDGYMFKSAMHDFGWDGAQAAGMRAQGEMFFRLREAPVRRWPGLEITGDQLFHMIFNVGPLAPSHSMMLCMFLGLLAFSDGLPERAHEVAPESGNAMQMIDLMNTLAFAAKHELDVLVDS